MKIKEKIESKVEEARRKFDLAKASVGKPQSISYWLEKTLKEIYKQGFKDGKNT